MLTNGNTAIEGETVCPVSPRAMSREVSATGCANARSTVSSESSTAVLRRLRGLHDQSDKTSTQDPSKCGCKRDSVSQTVDYHRKVETRDNATFQFYPSPTRPISMSATGLQGLLKQCPSLTGPVNFSGSKPVNSDRTKAAAPRIKSELLACGVEFKNGDGGNDE